MSTTDEQAKLWELIKDTRFGMLTHRHDDGQLHSHPLTTQNKKLDEGGTLYFFVPKDGDIARHVVDDPSQRGLCQHRRGQLCLDLRPGRAGRGPGQEGGTVQDDGQGWFPHGAAIRTWACWPSDIVDAEYWDVKDSKMVQLLKMATAAVTGKPPTDLGEHRKLDVA